MLITFILVGYHELIHEDKEIDCNRPQRAKQVIWPKFIVTSIVWHVASKDIVL